MNGEIKNQFSRIIADDVSGAPDEFALFLSAHGITFEAGPSQAIDQYGNDYFVLATDGMREEDCRSPAVWYSSYRECIDTYRASLLRVIGSRKHIVWRIEPEMEVIQNPKGVGKYRMYSRLTAYQERPA